MNTEFFNKYVDNLNTEIIELNKVRMMMKTQIDMLDEANKRLTEKIKELEESLDKPEPEEKESF
jgi:hypothetical protein